MAPEDPGIKICPDKTLPDSDDGGDVSPPQREVSRKIQIGSEPRSSMAAIRVRKQGVRLDGCDRIKLPACVWVRGEGVAER